jgi:outer membrane protein
VDTENFPIASSGNVDSIGPVAIFGWRAACLVRRAMESRHRRLAAFGVLVANLAVSRAARSQPSPEPPPTSNGIEKASRTMTLDEALAFARAHHLRLAAARQRIVAAEREAEVASAQWLPRVGAMAQVVGSTANNSTTTLLGTGTVDLPRIGATPVKGNYDWQPYPSTAVAIGIRQQLYDFGRVQAERAAGDLATAVERYRASGNALDIDFAVRQAYYAVLAADAIADASRAAFVRASSHRDLARANVRSGLRPPIEQTRAEADVARYEAGMMRARASVHVARTAFAATVGADDAELGASPAPLDGSGLPAVESLVRHAERSPLILEGRARVDAQQAETRRLEAQTRPTLWATASASGRAGGATPSSGPTPDGEGLLPTVPNYSAAVVLTWPILEPTWDRRADASRAREQALTSEAEFALRTQRALIRTAYQEALVARETLDAAERGAEAARSNWDQAEHRFGVGLGTSTELADAQALRTEAEIQLAIAKFQTARARAALERAAAEISRVSEGR